MKIETKSQYHLAMAKIEKFIQKGFSNLSSDEADQLEKISLAVEAYEDIAYPMPLPVTAKDMLEGN